MVLERSPLIYNCYNLILFHKKILTQERIRIFKLSHKDLPHQVRHKLLVQ